MLKFSCLPMVCLLLISGCQTPDSQSPGTLQRQADRGNPEAQYELGRLYEKGDGVATNQQTAIDWYTKSAEQGYDKAQNSLGYCYETGQGVGTNQEVAVEWYRKAGDQGNKVAQCNLGQCYRVGRGVETNLVEAAKWYALSAEQGYAKAQHRLGWLYLKGDGVEKNQERAVEWFHKAAAQDYIDSMISLSFRYKKGEGVKTDLGEANRWYDKAVELGYTGSATRPLPDYAGNFEKLDAQIRAIDFTDPSCTNYVYLMTEAVDCKTDLELGQDIDPWLEELSSAGSNNWKILHAVAMGYCHAQLNIDDDKVHELNRWKALCLMDRAYRLLPNPPPAEAGQFFEDYISILVGTLDIRQLKIKTIDLPLEEVGEKESSKALVFFDCPESYETAVNDGELIRWLLEQNREEARTRWSREWCLADFAVILAGAHRGLPRWERNSLEDWEQTCSVEVKEILAGLADDETVVWDWTLENKKHTIQKLPPDYIYIPAYERRAEQGDKEAILILATLFKNRCQLERAAHYFELDGDTNIVRAIRASQGSMVECKAQPVGKNPRIDYIFRNGTEVEFSVFRINVGTNLLERLQKQEMPYSELELLKGNSYWFRRTGKLERPGVADERVASWTVPLEPLSDHRDTTKEISVPLLPAGNYLVRAQMKDGNQAETILNIYDTTLTYAFTETNRVNFVLLYDALTGKPLPNSTLTFMALSGGTYLEEDGACIINHQFEGKTNEDGLYVFPDGMTNGNWTVIARADQQMRLVTSCGTYNEYRRSYSPVGSKNCFEGEFWWHGDQFKGPGKTSSDVSSDSSMSEASHADQPKQGFRFWLEKAFFGQDEEVVCHVDFNGEPDGFRVGVFRVSGTNSVQVLNRDVVQMQVSLGQLEPGLYEVRATAGDRLVSAPFRFFVRGGNDSGLSAETPIRLVHEKGVYTPGDTANVLVQVDQPGRYVYFFERVAGRDVYSLPEVIFMDETSKVIPLQLAAHKTGFLQCAAMTVVDGQSHIQSCDIPVDGDSSFQSHLWSNLLLHDSWPYDGADVVAPDWAMESLDAEGYYSLYEIYAKGFFYPYMLK